MEILIRFHAALMLFAFSLMVAGFFVAHSGRRRVWWLKTHKALGLTGASLMLLGLLTEVLDISLTGRDHLAVPHAWVGLVVITLGILTPILGFAQIRSGGSMPFLRVVHRWSGRTTLVLMTVNIVLGLRTAGLI